MFQQFFAYSCTWIFLPEAARGRRNPRDSSLSLIWKMNVSAVWKASADYDCYLVEKSITFRTCWKMLVLRGVWRIPWCLLFGSPVWLKARSDVIVCLQFHSQHTACSLKCLLAQASAGHENPKEAKESGMKFVVCEICTWDQRLPPAKSRLS